MNSPRLERSGHSQRSHVGEALKRRCLHGSIVSVASFGYV
uniref:Uncharacterized protein n=1 Tax=Romanomermis culicivorax TaxID=13658 RepID=A0A915J0J7_ROMCU